MTINSTPHDPFRAGPKRHNGLARPHGHDRSVIGLTNPIYFVNLMISQILFVKYVFK